MATILDPEASFPGSINQIGSYFQDRIRDYYKLPLDDAFADYERSISDPRNAMPSFEKGPARYAPRFEGIGVSKEEADVGEARLLKLFEEILELTPNMSSEELKMCQRDQGRQRRRELLCIGSTDIQVEVNQHGRVNIIANVDGCPSPGPMLNGPALPGVSPGKGEGAVEAYMLPGLNGRAILASRDRECVFAYFDTTVTEAHRKRVMAECGHRRKDLEYIREQETLLTNYLASEPLTSC